MGDDRKGDREPPATSAILKFLEVAVSDMAFCIELGQVGMVLPLVALRPVPEAPSYFKGLMNLHGDSVPVLDLAERLGLRNEQPYTLETPIVVCKAGGRLGGVIVSETLEVSSIGTDLVQLYPMFESDTSPFKGVIVTGNRQSLLIDVARVLDMDISGQGPDLRIDPRLLSDVRAAP